MLKIITISGLDGSGKSTQIKLLQKHLELNGEKVFYFHAISFSLPNKILAYFKNSKKETSKKNRSSVAISSWLGILLRKIILPIDLWRFQLLLNKLSNKKYTYILSDRYFYDTLVNIEYLSKKTLKFILTIPKPDLSIYLQANPEVIMTRSKDAPDQGLKFLKDKKKLYDAKIETWNWQVIDNTNLTKEMTADSIWKIISKQ